MASAPHKAGYYFAQQFSFNGARDVGHTGLQPRPDALGSSIVYAVFSTFVPGATSTDPNCLDDGRIGLGINCIVDISSTICSALSAVVKNREGTTWTGTLVDTVSSNSTHVGFYTLPNGAGGIKASESGFIQYYPWNGMANPPCDSLPYTNVTFGAPTMSTFGAGSGQLKPYEYGDCVGKVNFDVHETAQGYQVSVGF